MSTSTTPVVICSICNTKFVDRATYGDHRRHNGATIACVRPVNDFELNWHQENGVWEHYGILRIVDTDEILNYYGGGTQ